MAAHNEIQNASVCQHYACIIILSQHQLPTVINCANSTTCIYMYKHMYIYMEWTHIHVHRELSVLLSTL